MNNQPSPTQTTGHCYITTSDPNPNLASYTNPNHEPPIKTRLEIVINDRGRGPPALFFSAKFVELIMELMQHDCQ